ncbi:MAG TPA: undecaprenyldiphospho-muramoylpentapeptide beta-N-acetylglucosaminyltransferase [Chloroflexota bacterium]|nr:undecaprenyldiphospho-muramoylpentapeptide beta-N-acetylglucosaminyltransferase [Chloroflexota bacterium]
MRDGLRIVLTGGGTGGHVYPALAAARAGRSDASGRLDFLYVGSPDGLEEGIVHGAGLTFETVDAGAIRGRTPLAAARSVLRMARGVQQARAMLARYRPHAVLATGGFVCVPVMIAARLAGVPGIVYLPDLRPGWAVRFLSRIATAVAVSFDEVTPHIHARRVVVTGYPVRPELLDWTRDRARAALDLPGGQPVVLVLGGSRGAQAINEAILADLPRLLESAVVVHASGAQHFAVLARRRQTLPENLQARYRLHPYLDKELAPAMVAADLVVSRSGASVLGELPAAGVPGVLVPYPYAGAHQYLNANYLADRHAAVIVDDADARAGALATTILDLIADRPRLAELARNTAALARPDAARRLFELVRDSAGGTPTLVNELTS